jgi:DNA-binding NtrC family response regulator
MRTWWSTARDERAMELLGLTRVDVVLTDRGELVGKVRVAYPASQVVVISAHGNIDSAVQAMKNGAFYYLTKPSDRETLVMTVAKAAELANLQQERMLRKKRRRLINRRLEGGFELPPAGVNWEELERDAVRQALDKSDWVIAKAAKMLGMSYRTLQYRIDKFGLQRGDSRRH